MDAYVAREYEAPLPGVESAVATIWCELLRCDRVGRQDNFFELGGHSLLAITLLERMRQAGLQTEVRHVFTSSTLAALASVTAELEEVLL
jgi:arthrofactin-type cyclic lipopeptide synthetase B